MRVLVVDDLAEDLEERATILREGLARAGHDVVASLSSPLELLRAVERLRPDVIVIDTESPTRDVLEHLVIVSQSSPRPIVMFASDSGGQAIREAVRAGVSAYVVDGLDAGRVNSIVDVACAQFNDLQSLKTELAEANLKLSERKLVERAKGLLMQSRGLSEDDAYHSLRKLAMAKKLRLGDVAQQVIDTAELLGKA
ncbi:MAG TPA: ANTAR domain-containing protein [Burkholderiales bacterium]|nr:ANTAR domain-containing protein [Burkholderiales bacterium]